MLNFKGTLEQRQANEFVKGLLSTLSLMLELGCFAERSVQQQESHSYSHTSFDLDSLKLLCGLLTELLDGRNDLNLNDNDSPSRFTLSAATRPIFSAKQIITSILEVCLPLPTEPCQPADIRLSASMLAPVAVPHGCCPAVDAVRRAPR